MNLLEALPKRTVSKIKSTKYTNGCFFSYDKRVITSHLDARNVVFSDIPGNTDMTVAEMLNKKR